jgi:hypothetical protein
VYGLFLPDCQHVVVLAAHNTIAELLDMKGISHTHCRGAQIKTADRFLNVSDMRVSLTAYLPQCPAATVLGMSIACAAAAVLLLPVLFRPQELASCTLLAA